MHFLTFLKTLRTDIRGTTTTEYGFLLLLVVTGLIFVVSGLGGENGGLWGDNLDKITTAMGQ